jgi:hypothetical protein
MRKLLSLAKDEGGALGCFLVCLVVVLTVGIFFFDAWLVMLLWNATIATLFAAVPSIGYWMACGILILCNLLFKSRASSSSISD